MYSGLVWYRHPPSADTNSGLLDTKVSARYKQRKCICAVDRIPLYYTLPLRPIVMDGLDCALLGTCGHTTTFVALVTSIQVCVGYIEISASS